MSLLLLKYFLGFLFFFNSPDPFSKSLENYLKNELSEYERFEIKKIQLPREFESLQIDESRKFSLNRGIGYVPVIITRRNNQTTSSFVSVELTLHKTVILSKSFIRKGEQLTESNYEVKEIDVSNINRSFLDTKTDFSKLRATTNIKEGLVLIEEQFENIPAVKNGDKVFALTVRGNVSVSIDSFVKQDGDIGDIIKIETVDNKIFRAKVIDSQTVIINE